jgi:hypothetical protein
MYAIDLLVILFVENAYLMSRMVQQTVDELHGSSLSYVKYLSMHGCMSYFSPGN